MKVDQLKKFQRLFATTTKSYAGISKLIRKGNTKLPKQTAIFNMGSATDCPAKKIGLCSACIARTKCYAMKSEVPSRPQVLPFRRRQEKFWKGVTAEKFALEFLALNAMKPVPFTAMRLNEAGDFWDQDCIEKAETIAKILKGFGVKVYCYTSRSDLDFTGTKHLVVNGSGFRKPGITSEFKIIPSEKDLPKGYKLCPQDCKICDRCSFKGKLTAVVKH